MLRVGQATTLRLSPNHKFLDDIAALLSRDINRLDPGAPIALNSSIQRSGGAFAWKQAAADAPGEPLRRGRVAYRSSSAPFLKMLDRLFAGGTRSLPLSQLLRQAGLLLPQIPSGKIEELLQSAWSFGFIELERDYAGNADRHLASLVERLAEPDRAQARRRLAELVQARERMDPAGIKSAISGWLKESGASEEQGVSGSAAYEERAVAGHAFSLSPDALAEPMADLAALLRLAPALLCDSFTANLGYAVRDEFLERFGPGGEAEDAFAFLEGSARELDRLLADDPASFHQRARSYKQGSSEYRFLAEAKRRLLQALVERTGECGSVELDREDLLAFCFGKDEPVMSRQITQIFFVQPYRAGEGRKFVVNGIYAGGASIFSRFLQDEQWAVDGVRSYLRQLAQPAEPTELVADFAFNACDHPPLADRFVSVPPQHSPATASMPLTQLKLRHRPDRDDLVFVDEQGGEVPIFYPAVLSLAMMPRVEQIVRLLGSWVEMVLDLPEALLPIMPWADDGTQSVPRMSIGSVTILRRQLRVRRSALPSVTLPAHLFYAELNRWADGRGLPRRLFVRRAYEWSAESFASTAENRKTSHKPIPLDRLDPLAMLIVQKEIAKTDRDFIFVEALPNPDDCFVRRGDEPAIAELGIELTRLAGS
jgi:hypothetical protein